MTKATKELIDAAKVASRWIRGVKVPNELVKPLQRLETAIKQAEKENRRRKDRINAKATV